MTGGCDSGSEKVHKKSGLFRLLTGTSEEPAWQRIENREKSFAIPDSRYEIHESQFTKRLS